MNRPNLTILGLLLALSVFVQTTSAQYLPTDARALNSSRVPFLFATDNPKTVPLVEQVNAIGMTVSSFISAARSSLPLSPTAGSKQM